MLNLESYRWRSPDEAPTRRERIMGIVVRLKYRLSKAEITAPSRYWRIDKKHHWGPANAFYPLVWEDIGAEVIAWAVKRPERVQEAA